MQIHSVHSSAGYAAWSAMRAGQSSREAEEAASASESTAPVDGAGNQEARVDEAQAPDEAATPKAAAESEDELSVEDLRVVQQLRQRDQEVRAHEMAHMSAGGQYVTSSPSYEYQTGPDGQRYAVGGEVGIDASAISGDPEATLQKAQAVMRAALAPAEPSGQDQRVAAAAKSMASEALVELAAIESEAAAGEAPGVAARKPEEASEGAETNQRLDDQSEKDGTAGAAGDVSGGPRIQLEQRIAAFFAGPQSAFDLQA